jgi:hypothetical protein
VCCVGRAKEKTRKKMPGSQAIEGRWVYDTIVTYLIRCCTAMISINSSDASM